MYAMVDRENTGAAISSGAEDAIFWALVCEDEDWWRAEFEALIGEAREAPRSPTRVQLATVGTHSRFALARSATVPDRHPRRRSDRTDEQWSRERSPPR